jgi:hypothetical protein
MASPGSASSEHLCGGDLQTPLVAMLWRPCTWPRPNGQVGATGIWPSALFKEPHGASRVREAIGADWLRS